MADEERAPAPDPRTREVLEIPLHRFLDLRLADAADPAAGVVLEVGRAALNQANVLHGGIALALLDVASYLALAPVLGADDHAVTHEMAVQLLRPVAAGARVHFRGQLLKAGRHVVFLRAEGWVDGVLVASAQVTKTRVLAGGGGSPAAAIG